MNGRIRLGDAITKGSDNIVGEPVIRVGQYPLMPIGDDAALQLYEYGLGGSPLPLPSILVLI